MFCQYCIRTHPKISEKISTANCCSRVFPDRNEIVSAYLVCSFRKRPLLCFTHNFKRKQHWMFMGGANFKKSMMSIHYAAYTIALLNLCSSFSEGIAFWVFSARLAASMAAASRFRFTYGCFCSWCLSSSSNSSGGTSHEHIHLQIRPLAISHSMPRDSLHVSQSWCKWLAKNNYYWVNNMIPSNYEGLIAGQAKMFASTGQPCLVL